MAVNRGPADSFEEENVVRLSLDSPLEPRDSEWLIGPDLLSGQGPIITNGYVEVDKDGKAHVVKRPGRTLQISSNAAATSSFMGIHTHYGRTMDAFETDWDPSAILAVVYNNALRIANLIDSVYSQVFTGLFSGSGSTVTANIDPVYFENVFLPDLDREAGKFGISTNTASPPLEGFFINSSFEGYFYNTQSRSLTKIVSPNYPKHTVGGAAWLNGRFYIMTIEGRIYASAINDPYTWSALDFINAIMNPDRGAGVFRRHNYLMALGKDSTEWFYDSGAATGNPLRRVDSAAHDFGALHVGSVVKLGDSTVFVGTAEKSREIGVYQLDGYVPKKISTPFIDKLIARTDFDCIWSYPIVFEGHRFYMLNTCCTTFTLVYDFDTNRWFIWNSSFMRVLSDPVLTAALDTSSGLVEVTVSAVTAHSSAIGSPVTISGATQTSYNGNFVINRILSGSSFTYLLPTNTVPTTPATGTIAVHLYPQVGANEWNSVAAIATTLSNLRASTTTFLLDPTNGNVYLLDENAPRDQVGISGGDTSFIGLTIRTTRGDMGNNLRKFISRLEVLGDKVDTSVLLRYSDDDYQTWTPYRLVNMDLERSKLHRQGSMRRRVYELYHPFTAVTFNENAAFRVESLELFYKQGSNV